MKFLLITDCPPSTQFSGTLLTKELCQYLPANSIYLFTAKTIYLTHLKTDEDLKLCGEFSTYKPMERTPQLKIPLINNILNNVIDWLHQSFNNTIIIKKLYRKVTEVIEREKIDKIWLILQGQTMINLGKLLIQRSSIPIYTQVWDAPEWWLINNNVNPLSTNKILQNYDYVISNSAACAVASDSMKQDYEKKYKIKCYTLIPSLNISIEDKNKTSLVDNLIYIGICGQLYAKDEWQALLCALEKNNWTIANKKIRIKYIGRDLADYENKNIENYGYKNQANVIKILRQCHILYCPYILKSEHIMVSKYSFPSKLVSYMFAGKPVFFHGPKYASPAQLITKKQFGIVCASLETENILESLYSLLNSEQKYLAMQEAARKTYTEKFTSQTVKKNFLQMLGIKTQTQQLSNNMV